MSWRDEVSEERPTVGLGALEDSPLEVRFQGEGEMSETKHGDALKVRCEIQDSPAGYTDMNGSELAEGDEVYLMSSSNRFMAALAGFADDLEGRKAEITADGESFDRTYNVE